MGSVSYAYGCPSFTLPNHFRYQLVRRRVLVGLAVLFVPVNIARSDPNALAEGRALLEKVEDHTFAFDDDAFYWYCEYLHALGSEDAERTEARDSLQTSVECDEGAAVPWRFLLERPDDYRGRMVCIEGRVLLEQPSYALPGRPHLGRLRQFELGTAGTGAVATLILLNDTTAIPKRSLIRVNAVFIKVRAFQSKSGGVGTGPLLVANAIEVVESAGHGAAGESAFSAGRVLPWMVGGTLLLFGIMVAIRRNVGATKKVSVESPVIAPRMTGTEADFDWLREENETDPRDR